MPKENKKIIDTTQESSAINPEPDAKAARGAFDKLKRELPESALKNPAVSKMLLTQNDKYEQEIEVLNEFKEKFYEADKKAGILQERLIGLEKSTTVKSILLTLGGILAGFLPSIWDQPKFFWAVAIISIIMFIIAILKPFQRNESRDK